VITITDTIAVITMAIITITIITIVIITITIIPNAIIAIAIITNSPGPNAHIYANWPQSVGSREQNPLDNLTWRSTLPKFQLSTFPAE
jgi:hypothetical protein